MTEDPANWILLEFHGILTFWLESGRFCQNTWERVKTSNSEPVIQTMSVHMLIKAKKRHKKSNNLPEIPPIPLITQCIVPHCWTHLSNTGCQLVCNHPCHLNILTHSPSGTLHVAEVEIGVTHITMSMMATSMHIMSGIHIHSGKSSICFESFSTIGK